MTSKPLRTALGLGVAATVLAPTLPAAAVGPAHSPDELYLIELNTDSTGSRVPYQGSIEAGDVPVFCDFEGDGFVPPRPIRFNSGVWDLPGDAASFSLGRAGDRPLCGDFDGDGDEEPAVRRGNRFFLGSQAVDGGAGVRSFSFGQLLDEPLVGDWDGDGVDQVAVRRGNTFFFSTAAVDGGGGVRSSSFGRSTDKAVAVHSSLTGRDFDTLAVRRGRTFFVSEEDVFGRVSASYDFTFGRPNDLPIVPGDGLLGVQRGTGGV